jgi:hypothetical protein
MPNLVSRLGLDASGLLLAAVAMATVANARSTTAFNAFKVQNPNALPDACGSNPECFAGYYQCLIEDNGAVVNNCPLTLGTKPPTVVPLPNLVFDLPVDTGGTKTIEVQPYWNSWNTAPEDNNPNNFECTAYAYTGTGPGTADGSYSSSIIFSRPEVTAGNVQVSVQSGGSIALICRAIPSGAGIANINWNPP